MHTLKDAQKLVSIVRIVGNELPPRHRTGSTAEQLKFIIENEPCDARVEKIWLLNRIIDAALEAELEAILSEYKCKYSILKFNIEEYQHYRNHFSLRTFLLSDTKRILQKAGFIIAINQARNEAMRIGAATADWVIPLDGGCCLDKTGFDAMLGRAITPERNVYALPTYRLIENSNYFHFSNGHYPMHESMLMIASNIKTPFDENRPYGNGEKLATMRRYFPKSAFEQTSHATIIKDPSFHAGYVLRLSSGNALAEGPYPQRVKLRMEGLRSLTDRVEMMLR